MNDPTTELLEGCQYEDLDRGEAPKPKTVAEFNSVEYKDEPEVLAKGRFTVQNDPDAGLSMATSVPVACPFPVSGKPPAPRRTTPGGSTSESEDGDKDDDRDIGSKIKTLAKSLHVDKDEVMKVGKPPMEEDEDEDQPQAVH